MRKILYYLPFILFGTVLLWFHFQIEVNYGDDVVFRKIAAASDFDLFSWLILRYRTWTSRTFIELLMMLMVSTPQIVWQVLNTILLTTTSIFISKIFCGEEDQFRKNWIIAGFSFTINIGGLKEAGWIATSLNYIWPLAFSMISVYPVRKIFSHKSFRFYEYLVYSVCLLVAISSEQFCIVLFITFGAANLIWYQRDKKINAYLISQFALCIVGLIYILICPGNAQRSVAEIAHWFPAYATFGIVKKAELGISYTLKTLFLQDNIWLLIFLFLLCAAIWMKHDNWIYRVTAIIPAASVVLLRHAHKGRGDNSLPFNLLNEMGMFRQDTVVSLKVLIIYTGLLFLCCIILTDIYILNGNTVATLLTGGTFLLGLMTRAMMGFSPTIWMSGGRTGICLMYALLCCSVLVINDWDLHEKKAADILYVLVILVAIGGFIDNYNDIFLNV